MDEQLISPPSSAVVRSSATTTASRPSKRVGGRGLVWGKKSMPLWPERQLFSRFEFPSFHGTVFRFQSQAQRSQGGRSAGAGSLEGGRGGGGGGRQGVGMEGACMTINGLTVQADDFTEEKRNPSGLVESFVPPFDFFPDVCSEPGVQVR